MMRCFRRHRHRQRQQSGYSRMSFQSDDSERDTMYLLCPNKVTVPPRRQLRKLRGLWLSVSKACYRRHQDIKNRIHQSFSIVTSPTSMPTTPGQEHSLSSDTSPKRGKMYYIISEVGSEAMRAEQQEQALARSFSSVWNDNDEQQERPSRKCTGLPRWSLSHCFTGPTLRGHFYEEGKEVETIPVSVECDGMSSVLSLDESDKSIVDEPRTISTRRTRSVPRVPSVVKYSRGKYPDKILASTDYPCQCRRVEKDMCLSRPPSSGRGNDQEYWTEDPSTDRRDDASTNRHDAENRERLHLLFPPPLLPLRHDVQNPSAVLGVAFPHPGAVEEPFYPMLCVHSAHPHWLERESTNVWEEMDMASFFMDDGEENSLRPSPIQVESWTDNKWMEEPSIAPSIVADDVDASLKFEQQENNNHPSPIQVDSWTTRKWMEATSFLPSMSTDNGESLKMDQEKGLPSKSEASSPMDWTRKIYQPIFRFAKEVTTCGQLNDIDEAPFDEVKDDMSRNLFEDVVFARRKAGIRPLKPNPKDSPSYAWLRQIGLTKKPLWDDFFR